MNKKIIGVKDSCIQSQVMGNMGLKFCCGYGKGSKGVRSGPQIPILDFFSFCKSSSHQIIVAFFFFFIQWSLSFFI